MEKMRPYHWGKPPVLRVTGARRQSLSVARHGTLCHTTCYYYYYYYCYCYYCYYYYFYYNY